jgi:hypothetical protein
MKNNLLLLFARLFPLLALLLVAGSLLILVRHFGGAHPNQSTLSRSYGAAFGAPPIKDGRPTDAAVMQEPVFEGVIEPILRHLCLDCHGAEKQRSHVRLDSFEACLRGGKNGPIIKPFRASESSLIQRLQLSVYADGHMPPEDQSQPTAEEITLLEWWINAGAPAHTKLSEMKLTPEIDRCLKLARLPPGE